MQRSNVLDLIKPIHSRRFCLRRRCFSKTMSKALSECWYTEFAKKNISWNSEATFYNDIAVCCVNGLTMVLNLLANGFVVYRYYVTRRRQPVSNTLLFFLALLYILQGIIAQPVIISMYILEVYDRFYCALQRAAEGTLSVFMGYSFIMATIILTSERNFAILYPIRHRVYMTKKVLSYFSLTVFAIWAVFASVCHITLPRLTELYYLYLCILSFGLVYTLVVYVNIFRESRKLTARLTEKLESTRSPSVDGLGDKGQNRKRLSVDGKNSEESGTVSEQNSGNF